MKKLPLDMWSKFAIVRRKERLSSCQQITEEKKKVEEEEAAEEKAAGGAREVFDVTTSNTGWMTTTKKGKSLFKIVKEVVPCFAWNLSGSFMMRAQEDYNKSLSRRVLFLES